MGLMQKAVETYDHMRHLIGIEQIGQETLAPISHIIARAKIEITLNQAGEFIAAQTVDKEAPKIPIPATEDSAGRTSAPCPHPLCDQLSYLATYDQNKHQLYLQQLEAWVNSQYSHPMLPPILQYVQAGTILADLQKAQVIELTTAGKPKDEKMLVCWIVNGLGQAGGPCWKNLQLQQCFTEYYQSICQNEETDCFCMISGETGLPAKQHLKGVIPMNGNAKLISANDKSGFTYRGRFMEEWQAATVSYIASQKAHNALRWLTANQGVSIGGRTFICWNPEGKPLPKVTGFMARRGKDTPPPATPTAYRQQLQEALQGWRRRLQPNDGAIIAAFDAATTGRLAVTYYGELLASDFLERLYRWEDSCCWPKGKGEIASPSLFKIINWAFGTPRDGKVQADDRIMRQQIQRLVACRINQAPFPLDIIKALAEKAANMIVYYKKLQDENKIQELLFTACAAIKKYQYDNYKEEWSMALEKENTNRSYLFGRLLAIADTVESITYNEIKEKRETNAMRMQKIFVQRPMTTWAVLEERLKPYYARLKPYQRQYYRRTTEEIMNKLSSADPELNRKLEEVYLLGYYHQKAYRSTASAEIDNTEIDNEAYENNENI